MDKTTFSILITTKNRKTDLAFTLQNINYLLVQDTVEFVVYDDGSFDGSYDYVKQNYPNIQLHRNETSKGYIFCRNEMLNNTKADFAISLDDDAHFVTDNPLEIIRNYFEQNAKCGLIAMRIFWGLNEPASNLSSEKPQRVQGFVGCAHIWRMAAWRTIPNYPVWFVFYGEENFASYQLFKKKWEIHYLPAVLVNHRVDVKARRNNSDYTLRFRRSLRSGWYLVFLFYPTGSIPKNLSYSIWMQFRYKVFKGDFEAFKAIIFALLDLILNMPRIIKNSNRLTQKEYETYNQLAETKIYWKPKSAEM